MQQQVWISDKVRHKLLTKHSVTEEEIVQCFHNHEEGYFRDTREEHNTDPPSWWFIAETNRRRKLKVVFMLRKLGPDGVRTRIEIKSAFEPNETELDLFARAGK